AISKTWYKKVSYKALDLSTLNEHKNYFEYFDKPDILIHLAWEGLPNYLASFHLEQNLPRHKMFLNNLIKHGLKNITVTGTCFEYGMQQGCLIETLPCNPENAYGKSKLSLYNFLENLSTE